MKLKFNDEQLELIQKIDIPFDATKNLTDDQICELIDIVGDYHVLKTLDINYKPNKHGEICLDILQMLAEL